MLCWIFWNWNWRLKFVEFFSITLSVFVWIRNQPLFFSILPVWKVKVIQQKPTHIIANTERERQAFDRHPLTLGDDCDASRRAGGRASYLLSYRENNIYLFGKRASAQSQVGMSPPSSLTDFDKWWWPPKRERDTERTRRQSERRKKLWQGYARNAASDWCRSKNNQILIIGLDLCGCSRSGIGRFMFWKVIPIK